MHPTFSTVLIWKVYFENGCILIKYNQLSLTKKFIFYLGLIGIIPILMVGITSFSLSNSVVSKESDFYSAQMMKLQKKYLEEHLSNAESILETLINSETIVEYVSLPESQRNETNISGGINSGI